ncbi:MAG TPA: hypothetical protein VFR57_03885 [Burkholderiales bacterium]|nr:hypothetical protein [Burkholderiales bacterium]
MLIAVTAWLAHLHVVAQIYHPVVRLSSPDGLVYTAVQDAKVERQACGAANTRFLGPVKQGCKDCKVIAARCERQLEGIALAISEGKKLPHHQIRGPGLRMVIAGPVEFARASCEHIVVEMRRNGLRGTCVHPS